MRVEKLNEQFGVRISQIDITSVSDYDAQHLRDLLYRHKLLYFVGCVVDDQQYVDFCQLFGDVWSERLMEGNNEKACTLGSESNIGRVSNSGGLLKSLEIDWHIDVNHRHSWLEGGVMPLRALKAAVMPAGDTSCNWTAWIDRGELYQRVVQHQLNHYFDGKVAKFGAPYPTSWSPVYRSAVSERDESKYLEVECVFTRELDGQQWGFVNSCDNPYYSDLYFKLKDIMWNECTMYKHWWSVNDIIVYDNYTTAHYRPGLQAVSEERTLHRVTMQNDRYKTKWQYEQ